MTRRLHLMRLGTLVALAALCTGCDAAKAKLAAAAGTKMTFTGTVLRAGTTTPIAGANVALIPLASLDTLKSLVEYKKIPDGKGGLKDRIRVKLDKVQAFADGNADVVKTTTDATGKFKTEAPLNVYLVYTAGPGDKPGSTAVSYGAHFWGLDPETGELTPNALIGKNLNAAQNNDTIQLSGGPVPPAATPAATPMPPAVVVPPVPPAAPVDAVQAEPTPGSPTPLPPGNIVPPAAPSTAFWKSVKLTFKDGFIGTGGPLETKTAPAVDSERFLELTAELVAGQTEPVYLVLQKGFDSSYVTGCENTNAASTTRVYPVNVNGTTVTYQLVPPGPFYKLLLVKSATVAKEGDAPTVMTEPSETLTVGERTCANAVPERPFLATLAWDKEVDIDLHVTKYAAAKIGAATTGEQIGEAVVDKASYQQRQGTTLSLDVDNTYAYGPENNGEAATVLDVDDYCYMVQVHYYSGSADPVTAKVDITMVSTVAGKKNVKQIPNSVVLNKRDDWKTIGAFGPAACAKLLNPPSTPENVIAYPPLSSCTIADYCAIQGDQPGKFKATVTLEKTSFAANEAVKVDYSNMPGVSGDWITIVPKAQTDKSWCSWQWSSGTSGTQWYGGMPPGEYEVRMYYGWSPGQCEVIGRTAFTVTP